MRECGEVRGTPCAVRGRKAQETDGKGKKKSAGVPRFCGLYCVLWGLQRSADRVQGDRGAEDDAEHEARHADEEGDRGEEEAQPCDAGAGL